MGQMTPKVVHSSPDLPRLSYGSCSCWGRTGTKNAASAPSEGGPKALRTSPAVGKSREAATVGSSASGSTPAYCTAISSGSTTTGGKAPFESTIDGQTGDGRSHAGPSAECIATDPTPSATPGNAPACESWLTAAIPMDNPYCKLTRVTEQAEALGCGPVGALRLECHREGELE